jgi:hypothetical protein
MSQFCRGVKESRQTKYDSAKKFASSDKIVIFCRLRTAGRIAFVVHVVISINLVLLEHGRMIHIG